jgi:hypothetical protein
MWFGVVAGGRLAELLSLHLLDLADDIKTVGVV